MMKFMTNTTAGQPENLVARLKAFSTTQVFRFLIAGTFAAFVNWVARIALSVFLPFEASILLAYIIGMSTGYVLYARYVYVDRQVRSDTWRSVGVFLIVNVLSAGLVLGLSIVFLSGLSALFPTFVAEALAHGFAMVIGAVANYIAHSRITFR